MRNQSTLETTSHQRSRTIHGRGSDTGMLSFIQTLRDGFIVAGENWRSVAVILSLILLSQFFIQGVMKWLFGDQLTREEYFSLGMAGWLLPASLLSIFWYMLRTAILPHLSGAVILSLPAILAVVPFLRVPQHVTQRLNATLLGLAICVCISIPLRLAFISSVLLPLYFDPIRHYTIIEGMLGRIEPATPAVTFAWLTSDYYHIGFHFLTACITSIQDADTAQIMLVLGQIILAAAPLGVFFLIKHVTGSNSAAIFAVLLAGFGWSMPGYALNWGKYPAVTSLALLPFVLSMAYLAVRSTNELTKAGRWVFSIMLACAIVVSGLLHSRALVVLVIVVLAWRIGGWWQALPRQPRGILFCGVLVGILVAGVFIDRQDVLQPLFNPYVRQRVHITIMVLFLSIFAQKAYARLAFTNLIAILLLLVALFIPTVNLVPRLANLTLLDRPFVEMLLHLPLALLGALGLAGLGQTLTLEWKGLAFRAELAGILFIGFLIGNAILQYDFHPSDCCTIMGRDDMAAMEWIRSNIPADAHILISAEELTVLASGTVQGFAPADAGGWITPLTGRDTVLMLYDTDLSKVKQFKSLCKLGIEYIYIGGVGLSFHAPQLREHPDRYAALLSNSRVEIYQVTGCR
jgi:hypothetical protein